MSNDLTNILKKHINLLPIQLFAGLGDADLAPLLAQAKIKNFAEAEVLLHQGDQAPYFAILLAGQARIYRSHEDGREAVVNILTAGSTMFESIIVTGGPSPVSCEVSKQSEIIIIPKNIILKQLQTNPRLAANIAKSLAEQTNNMMFQLETVALCSAKERVGTFLLSSMLDQNQSGGDFKLAIDKSTIAHHLGMSAETLSRTLKSLKADGISVKGSTVTLSSTCSLCKFYDVVLAQKCIKADTPACPHYNKS